MNKPTNAYSKGSRQANDRPLRIELINAPFAAINLGRLSIEQLRYVLHEEFDDAVDINLRYWNHDFSRYFGTKEYMFISTGTQAEEIGMGEWFFRQAAFPDAPDNKNRFMSFARNALSIEDVEYFRSNILPKRTGLIEKMDELIIRDGINKADIVGFSSTFFQTIPSAAIARRIKHFNPGAIVVIGGNNCFRSMGVEMVHGLEAIDYVFSGPALVSFTKFVDAILQEKHEQLNHIDGVFSKSNCRSIASYSIPERKKITTRDLVNKDIALHGPERPLDQVVYVKFDEFLDSFDKNCSRELIEPAIPFETSRGCWWGEKHHCTFCGIRDEDLAFRSMSPEQAVAYLQDIFDKYATRCRNFDCVDLLVPRNYPKAVFPNINPPKDAVIFWEIRANTREEDLKTLVGAGIKYLQPGLESLNSDSLRMIRKGVTAHQNIMVLRDWPLHGVYVLWNFLIGFPGEPESVYQKYAEDIPKLYHLAAPAGIYTVDFHRNSPYVNEPEAFGLTLKPNPFYQHCFPFEADVINNIAYYFVSADAEHAQSFSRAVDWQDHLQKLVTRWRERYFHSDTCGEVAPRLILEQNGQGTDLRDSRSGQWVRHPLSPLEVDLLQWLERPRQTLTAAETFGGRYRESEVASALKALDQRGVVFTEGTRWVSLIQRSGDHAVNHGKEARKLMEPLYPSSFV